jgi:hypothetical protein
VYDLRDFDGFTVSAVPLTFSSGTHELIVESSDFGKCDTTETLSLVGWLSAWPGNSNSKDVIVTYTC